MTVDFYPYNTDGGPGNMPSLESHSIDQDYIASASLEAFGLMQITFQGAFENCGDAAVESHYIFAGLPVRIRVVGLRLAEYTLSPFSHLRTDHKNSDILNLTIDFWDESETGIPCPIGLPVSDLGLYRTVTASSDSRFLSDRDWRILMLLDRETRHAIGSFRSLERFLMADRARPFNRLLGLWYRDRGVHVIHSAMVSRNGNGVIFVGKGGSGKSTSALACVCAGLYYLGDDFIGLQEQSDGSFLGYSLYNSSLLDPDHLVCFPRLVPYAIDSGSAEDPKSLILISHAFPERLRRFARIRAVVIPCVVSAAHPRIRPASKGEALLALAPSSLRLQINPGSRELDQLARLVNRVPCYWLGLGENVDEIPQCIEELIEGIES